MTNNQAGMMLDKIQNGTAKVALIGLGYVGLPLAVEFGKRFDTIGFDIKEDRLDMLRRGVDVTLETAPEDLAAGTHTQRQDIPAETLANKKCFI